MNEQTNKILPIHTKVNHKTNKIVTEVNGLKLTPNIFDCLFKEAKEKGISAHAYLAKILTKHAVINNEDVFGKYYEPVSRRDIKRANGTWIEPEEFHKCA